MDRGSRKQSREKNNLGFLTQPTGKIKIVCLSFMITCNIISSFQASYYNSWNVAGTLCFNITPNVVICYINN